MDETERKPGRRFDLYGEIRNHVCHQRLIDERLLKGAAKPYDGRPAPAHDA
jgi:hypothetical protein